MKRFAVFATLLLLAGCSSGGPSDYSQLYQAMRQGVAASFGNARVTKTQAAAIPYASIGYRVNDGAEQMIVLATDTNGEQLWTSAAHIVIVMRNGRIVRTVGLAHDVSAMTPQAQQHLASPATAMKGPVTYTRLEDFADLPAYGAPVSCSMSLRGAQTIVILGHGVPTFRVDEVCHSTSLDWSFTDSFWLDQDSGIVWRSIQHTHPKGEKIETEILRPPG